MNLTSDQTKHIARLSALDISTEELDKYTTQFEEILAYIGKLQEIKTSETDTPIHPVTLPEPFREDRVNKDRQISRQNILGEKEYFEV